MKATASIGGVRAGIADVKERATKKAETVPGFDVVASTLTHDREVAGNVLASAVAYRLFLWILPLSLVLFAVLGFVRDQDVGAPDDVAEELGLSAYVASLVADAAGQAERSRWILLGLGLIALYSASAGAARTIVIAYSLVWEGRGAALSSNMKGALAFLGVATASVVVSTLSHMVQGALLDSWLLRQVLVLGLLVAFALGLSLLLPHADAPWPRLLPGALLIAVGVLALQVVTAIYLVGRIQSSSELYGGLGAAAAILLWLFILGRLLVGAAILDAVLWRRASASEDRRPAAGGAG